MHPRSESSQACSAIDWHTQTAQAVLTQLQVNPSGLTAEQVNQRLAQYGPNQLQTVRRRSPWLRLLLQFHNVLLYVMLAAAVVTAFLGHWIDTGVLLAAVVVNAVIGFVQEGKAESALDAIRAMLSPKAVVVRDGQRQEIDAVWLVPGDLVVLASGDRVPADLRLIQVKELRCDESTLTGESLPVEKNIAAVQADTPMGDRCGMAYAGTLVAYGQATGVVVATARETEIGRIDRMLADVAHSTTPLLRQIDRFGRMLAFVILLIAAMTFVLGVWFRGHAASEMFMMVVALVASAIPEGLPAIMTITLALGVQRMAKQRAIVRRLPAVETLGSVTVICSDKTGTLTRNEMTVQRVVCAGLDVTVTGAGYVPEGSLLVNENPIDPNRHEALALALRAGMLCNDARMVLNEQGQWCVVGDPTEGALLVLGGKAALQHASIVQAWPRKDSIPFESQHRFMATAHIDDEGQPWIFAKGAPEKMLDICTFEWGPEGERNLDVDTWRRMSTDIAARGQRLLGMACKRARSAGEILEHTDVQHGFTMLALVGIVDPPRDEAVRAVAQCHGAGIRVKMITGDHAETARAIGAQLAIGMEKPAVTGAELELMGAEELARVALEVDVFARASPEHKLRLVQALQQNGQVVAMTGDGVNDAPALKCADVGVSMGCKGTEAAKEASDVVLADDNFATIAAAVHEGRAVYDNIRKFILFMLPTNGGEGLVVIAAILFQLTLPMTAAQLLWINMVTSCTLGLALAFEPAEQGIMRRPPRSPQESLLTAGLLWRVVLVSVLMMAAALGLFLWELNQGTDVAVARTMAVTTIVMAEVFYLLSCRFVAAPALGGAAWNGNWMVLWTLLACLLMQMLFVHWPLMHAIFDSAALNSEQWTKVILGGVLVFVGAELDKWLSLHILQRKH